MGATSTTGTGYGNSNGLYKPENNSGCQCGVKAPEQKSIKIPKSHCVAKLNTGNRVIYRSNASGLKIRVCGN